MPGTDADRFYEALDRLGVPHRSVRCGLDVSPRLARDVVRAVRAEQPDLVHTHLVHADVYGGSAARLLGIPSISTRHNDDRYLLGPFRYVDRAFARPAKRLIAISDAVRRFLERAGHDPSKLLTIRYGLDELPAARSEPTPADGERQRRIPRDPGVGRRRLGRSGRELVEPVTHRYQLRRVVARPLEEKTHRIRDRDQAACRTREGAVDVAERAEQVAVVVVAGRDRRDPEQARCGAAVDVGVHEMGVDEVRLLRAHRADDVARHPRADVGAAVDQRWGTPSRSSAW